MTKFCVTSDRGVLITCDTAGVLNELDWSKPAIIYKDLNEIINNNILILISNHLDQHIKYLNPNTKRRKNNTASSPDFEFGLIPNIMTFAF